MRRLVLVVHNVRSAHNTGSLLRTADGLGVEKVYLTGYTPYPVTPDDKRLPHIGAKVTRQMHKTALGAEQSVTWEHAAEIRPVIDKLKLDGFIVLALEQAPGSVNLPNYTKKEPAALVVGNEISGLDEEVLGACDTVVSIPMAGRKESFNVAVAGAMALYHLKYR